MTHPFSEYYVPYDTPIPLTMTLYLRQTDTRISQMTSIQYNLTLTVGNSPPPFSALAPHPSKNGKKRI